MQFKPIKLSIFRSSCNQKRSDIWVLSWTIFGHHVQNTDPQTDGLLLLQPDSSLRAHCLYGCPGFHTPPRLWRKALPRWDMIFTGYNSDAIRFMRDAMNRMKAAMQECIALNMKKMFSLLYFRIRISEQQWVFFKQEAQLNVT